MENVSRHYIKWDMEKANRLYAFVADNPPTIENYFSFQVGQAIVNFTKFFVNDIEKCHVLDYGCGLGFLDEWFLKENATVSAVDMSPENVSIVNEKFKNYKSWKGAKVYSGGGVEYPDNFFDIITCTEVIEHMFDEHLEILLDELYRILKPSGKIIFTTPNDEDFSFGEKCCPECGCVFHQHGHVRKFSKDSLAKLLEKHGYSTVVTDVTSFWRFQETEPTFPGLLDVNLRFFLHKMKYAWLCLKDIKNKNTTNSYFFVSKIGTGGNLFYVGTK